MSDRKRKICVVVASRANYGRIKSVMTAIKEHPNLDLQLVVGASTLLARFGPAINVIREDGFEPDATIHYVVEGETPETQAKTTGLGIIELTTIFNTLKPDMVLTVADRYETMANAIAATYSNIPLIHVQGGELSGNIDDRVRHAITKLADLHFPCTEISRERIIRMGENSEAVFNYGCPAMDIALNSNLEINNEIMESYKGTGDPIDWAEPYLLLAQHPVTTSFGNGFEQIQESLYAMREFQGYQKIVLWPNIDAGADEVARGIRSFHENQLDQNARFHYFKNFSPEDFVRVLSNAKCCIGNSSSFIREGSTLGIPVVLVGNRQQGREHGNNIVSADYNRCDIKQKIATQLKADRYDRDSLFGTGNAGVQIAQKISEFPLPTTKQNTY